MTQKSNDNSEISKKQHCGKERQLKEVRDNA